MAGLSWVLMPVSLLLLFLALPASVAAAQETGSDFDPAPLRPADTSSPRDTLRSFLTNANELIEDRHGGASAAGYRAYDRTVQTLDLSTTPDGSFMIFADKPYKVGQRVKVMGQDGHVESIGLRSTKR